VECAVVKFRLGYLEDRLRRNRQRYRPAGRRVPQQSLPRLNQLPHGVSPGQPETTSAPSDAENQLRAVNEQMRQLQADKIDPRSQKLKEALAAQPRPWILANHESGERNQGAAERKRFIKSHHQPVKNKSARMSANPSANAEAETIAALRVEKKC